MLAQKNENKLLEQVTHRVLFCKSPGDGSVIVEMNLQRLKSEQGR